jgi:hypothetical protein
MKTLSLYVFLGLLWCNVAQALPDCEGSDFTKWTNCVGTYTDDKLNYYYSGEFGDKSGLRHGIGKINVDDGHFIYIGEFKNSNPDGLGFSKLKGETHVGQFKETIRHGWGITIKADGNKILGQWEEDHVSGYANVIGAGDYLILMKGNFKKSKLIKSSRHIQPQCKGDYVSPKVSKDWTNCRGQAEIVGAGIMYDADFVNGIPTGIASVRLFDGPLAKGTGFATGIYVGELKISKSNNWGERDGMGVHIADKDGTIQVGEWKEGFYDGKGITSWPNGDIFIGELKKNLRHGKGHYMHQDGGSHSGEYKDGKEHGYGIETYADGRKYAGEYKDGIKHGKGICTDSSGISTDCKMENGIWVK